MNADNWIAHLQHPLVLAGFGLFVFALVIRPLFSSSSKLSGAAIERMLHRGMILLFLLAIIAIIVGFKLSWKTTPAADNKGSNSSNTQTAAPVMTQKHIPIGQYLDNCDGTITDTKTGLMWKRCSEGLSGVNCEEGKAEGYKWDEAIQRFKNVEYAGYKDWRLPTIDELKTLVYCSKGKDKYNDCNYNSEKPTINQQSFPNTEATWFWSRSPSADGSVNAWCVGFFNGNSFISYRSVYYAVRLVRGGHSEQREESAATRP